MLGTDFRRKLQLIQLIDQAIPAKVTSEDGVEHTFMCVPEHRVDSMLRVELTHENVKLLTLKPRVEPEPIRFKPDIEEEHVKWVGCRSMVTCRYTMFCMVLLAVVAAAAAAVAVAVAVAQQKH